MKNGFWNRYLFLIVMLCMAPGLSAQNATDSDTTEAQVTIKNPTKRNDTVEITKTNDTLVHASTKGGDAASHLVKGIAGDVVPSSLKIKAGATDTSIGRKMDSIGKVITSRIKGIEDKLAGAVEGQVTSVAKKAESTAKGLIPSKDILPSKSKVKKLVKFGGGEITLGSSVRYTEGGVQDPTHYQVSADIRASVSIGVLPFSLGASCTYGDRQFGYQFSRIGFDFNSSAFLDSMKKKAMGSVKTGDLKDMASMSAVTNIYESGIKQMDSAYDQVKAAASYSNLKFTLQKYEERYAEEVKTSASKELLELKDTMVSAARTEADSISQKAQNTKTSQKAKQLYDSIQVLKRYYDKANELLTEVQKYKSQLEDGYKKAKDLYDNKKQLTDVGDGKDVESIGKMLRVNKLGFDKFLRAFAYLRKFNIGSSVLNASPLTATGYRVNGIQLEYNPSYIIGFAAGLNNFRVMDYFKTHKFDDRFIVHTRLGYGDLKKDYLVFNYAFGKILNNTMLTSSNDYSSPLSSYLHVVSLEAQWTYKKKVQAKGEVAYSLSKAAGETINGVTEGTVSKPSIGQIAFFGDVKGDLDKGFTYSATVSYLGGSFKNFNEAYQNNNLVRWNAGINQKLFKNKLTLSVRYTGFKNNLNHAAAYGSVLHQPIVNITLHLAKAPVITLISAPMYQDLHMDTINRHNTNIMHSLSMTYPYFKKDVTMATTLNVTVLNTRLMGDAHFTNEYNVILSQSVGYRSLSTALDLGYTRSLNVDLLTGEASVTYRFSKTILAGAGFKTAAMAFSSVTYGGSCNVSFDLKKLGMFKLRAEQSSTPNFVTQTFQNFLLLNVIYSKKF